MSFIGLLGEKLGCCFLLFFKGMTVAGTLDLVHSRQALYHRAALPAPGEEAGMGTCDDFPVSVWGVCTITY